MKTIIKQFNDLKMVPKLLIGALIGLVIGVGTLIKTEKKMAMNVGESIRENCNCEEVKFNFGAAGLQYTKDVGITYNRKAYTLKNCNYSGSAFDEAQRINESLKKSVRDYKSVNLIELSFQNDTKNEYVTIKNGIIL